MGEEFPLSLSYLDFRGQNMRKKLYLVLIILVMSMSFTVNLFAVGGFSVVLNLTENQNPNTVNFFNIRTVPGETLRFSVLVTNTEDTEIFIETQLFNATTTNHGNVDYASEGLIDITMETAFIDIANITGSSYKAIRVGESVEVEIQVDVPETPFDGIILGSIQIMRGISEEDRENAGMIVNRFAQVIPIRLYQNSTTVNPEFDLGDVYVDVVNGIATYVIELRNVKPRLTMGVWVNARVYQAGSNQSFFISERLVDFAPNTIFPMWLTDTEGFGVFAGEYNVKVEVTYEGQTWEFERELYIEPQVALDVNRGAINLQGAPINTDISTIVENQSGAVFNLERVLYGTTILSSIGVAFAITKVKKKNK